MTRLCYFGKPGKGKTLSAVYLVLEYYLKGFKVYSNINLTGIFKEWTYITNTNFKNVMDNQEKNIVLIDEIGKTMNRGKTVNAINFQNITAQSRKSFGEKSHLVLTTQNESYLKALEGLVDYEYFPEVVLRDEYSNKPIVIKLKIKKAYEIESMFGKRHAFKPFTTTFIYYGLYECCDYYDTNEEVNELGDGEFIKMKDEYPEYKGEKRKLEELSNRIQYEQGKNISESKRLARAVIYDFKDKTKKKKEEGKR